MGVGIAAGLLAGALWGLVFVAPRMVDGLSGVDLTAGRFVSFGLLALVVMLLSRRRSWPTWKHAQAAAVLSVLGFTGYYLLLVYGIRDAGTEVPTLIIGTIPLWMMILGKPGRLPWGALLPGMAMTALALVLMVEASGQYAATLSRGDSTFWRGVAFSVAAMLCWTAFGLLNALWLREHPEVSATDWANWLGLATGLGALLMWCVAGSSTQVLRSHPEIGWAMLVAASTGIGSAWVATILWNVASQRLSASLCGQLIASETLFALVYSFAWDGAWPGMAQWAAGTLFIGGIVFTVRAHQR